MYHPHHTHTPTAHYFSVFFFLLNDTVMNPSRHRRLHSEPQLVLPRYSTRSSTSQLLSSSHICSSLSASTATATALVQSLFIFLQIILIILKWPSSLIPSLHQTFSQYAYVIMSFSYLNFSQDHLAFKFSIIFSYCFRLRYPCIHIDTVPIRFPRSSVVPYASKHFFSFPLLSRFNLSRTHSKATAK